MSLVEELKTVENVNRKIRNVQSRKSRLRKQIKTDEYDSLMTEILQEEELLKEVKDYLEPKSKKVHEFNDEDIAKLNMDETLKAIKNMQSRKCLNQFTDEEIYNESLAQEEKLVAHKEKLELELNENIISKSELKVIRDKIEILTEKEFSREYVLSQLDELLK